MINLNRSGLPIGIVFALTCAALPAMCQTPQVIPGADPSHTPIELTPRIMPDNPVRIGGVYTSGLGSTSGLKPVSVGRNVLSAENQHWVAQNCDLIALAPSEIDPGTFPSMIKQQKLFTPLLYLYASSLYEGEHRGSVGGWRPEMSAWVLRRKDGSEEPYPEPGGHWMDFASTDWAEHWTKRINSLTQQYGAFGVVAAELPLGNTFTGGDLQKYHTVQDRAEATKTWLAAVRKGYRNLILPSAIGFDLAAGHETPDPHTPFIAPALTIRLWNDYFRLIDGAWCEGWVQPYWDRLPVSESLWETQLEAADRAGRLGQAFIVASAYRDDTELEFALASFLLIVHNQGRVVFQPMPIRPDEPQDAGFNLAVLQREIREKPQYFRVPLGRGMQERHQIPEEDGVWRRNFQFGDVYVNSDERKTITVRFGGNMRRLSGKVVRLVVLPPHSGAILLYAASSQQPAHTPAKRPAAKTSKSGSKG